MKMGEVILPNGWAMATVGDLADYVNGRAFKPTEWKDAGKPIIRIQNLNNVKAKYNFSPENHEEKYLVRNGDLLFAWSASLGAYIWRGGDAWLNQHIFVVHSKSCTIKLFIFYLLEKITAELYAKAHGSGMIHVTKGKFESTEILLPPINEQHRIVAKIEELFSELEKGIESLKTARAQLKVYRQALLKQAFEGKLTAQWRAENQDKLEPSAALQKRIQLERAQRYQHQLAEWETGGRQGSKPKAPKILLPFTASELAELPELPEGWGWFKLTNLSDISGGLTKNPKRNILPIKRPFLRVANVYANRLELDDMHVIGISEAEIERVVLVKGDILVVEGNGSVDQIGRVAIWNGAIDECVHQNHLIKARPLNFVCSEFILYFLMSELGRKFIVRAASSTSGLHTLSISKIESLFVPFCARAEQDVLLNELSAKLSLADQLDQTITSSLQQAEVLRQSILKKAFSGQLVPQGSHDEPASALLARIKAEKSAQSHSRKVRT